MNRNKNYQSYLISFFVMLSAGHLYFGQTERVSSSVQKIRTEEVPLQVNSDPARGSQDGEHEAPATKDTCGTRLIFTNGDELLCTIQEIGPMQISYIPCNNLSGPLHKTAKDRVFMIHYLNGTKEVVTKLETKEENDTAQGERRNGDAFVPSIPKGIHPKNRDLIVTKKGLRINCYIDRVSSKNISYHILRHGKDPHGMISLAEVSNYVHKYKVTVLN